MEAWEDEDSGSKIVVIGVKDHSGLEEIITKAELMEIGAFAIEDAGRTEVDPGTTTVAAIGPCYECLVNVITGHLRPYRDPQSIVGKPAVPATNQESPAEDNLKRTHEQTTVG
jgi:hypothetical protein